MQGFALDLGHAHKGPCKHYMACMQEIDGRFPIRLLRCQRSLTPTPRMRNTFLAAATEAWIFFALPGSPAEMNMQVYCKAAMQRLNSSSRPCRLAQHHRMVSYDRLLEEPR